MSKRDELRSQLHQVGDAIRTHSDPQSEEYQSLQAAWLATDKQLRQENAKVNEQVRSKLKSGVHNFTSEAGATFGAGAEKFSAARTDAFGQAMRVLESHYPRSLSADAAGAMEELLRHDTPTSIGAKYIAAVGDDAYNSAFSKVMADPQTGHLRMTGEEHEAMRRVHDVEAERALGEGSGAVGQFALPLTLDPTIQLTSSGAINPIREMSTVTQISTFLWNGVSSTGVTASYQAEAGTATDNSPTLAQPSVTPQRAQCFVPFSYELGQDWNGLQAEMAKLFQDARDVLEATKFLTGSGTVEPQGVLTGLGTAQQVTTAGTALYAVADAYSLREAVPARWYNTSTVLWSPTVGDLTWKLVAAGDTTNARIMANGRGGDFLGWPVREASTMATATTSGQKIVVAGDFKAAYRIIDRIGTSVELIPNLMGATGFPTGQRGLYAFWRNSAVVQAANALRVLVVK